MSPWLSSLYAIAVVSAIPLLVTVLLAFKERSVRRFLPHLTAFGAGALFGAAIIHLIPEALESGRTPWQVVIGLVVGYGAFALVERLLANHDHAHAHGIELGAPHAHHATGTAPVGQLKQGVTAPGIEPETLPPSLVPLAFVGDAVHNLVDGMLIAAGFLTNPGFGFLTALAIGLHELPREVGTYGIFVHGGVHPMRAVWYNIITAIVSLAGAGATLALGSRIADFGLIILPFAAGSYVYIAVAIGVPALTRHSASGRRWQAAWLASGFVLMGVSAVLSRST